MITDEQAEKAAEYIRDHAQAYGKAKGERLYLQEFRKSQKAMLMNEKPGEPEHVRASYAYAHKDYVENLKAYQMATEEEENLRWMMEAARIKTEIWRTQQANNRNIDKTHR